MAANDPVKLRRQFPLLPDDDIESLCKQYSSLTVNPGYMVDQRDVLKICQNLDSAYTYDAVRSAIKRANLNATGRFEVEDILEVASQLRKSRPDEVEGIADSRRVITVGGSHTDTAHSINEDEKAEFAEHINFVLDGDSNLKDRLPINKNTMQLFDECRDGIVLCKLINISVPDTIDERVLNVGRKLNTFQMTENNNLLINSAKAIGCNVVNIGTMDLIESREHLILGLIWQIIRTGLLAKVDIKYHPELYRLLEEDEALEAFLRLPPDQILLRWINYHLKAANWPRRVNNFGPDLKDGENYTILLNRLAPQECSRDPLRETNLLRRAEMVLENAEKIGCRKYLTPKTLVSGNPRLNLAFVANLFNMRPGLEALEETDQAEIETTLLDEASEREARTYALWLNSLGVEPYVNNLFDDVQDGLVLIQALKHIRPDLVRESQYNRRTGMNRFKKVENTNYLVELGKHLKFSLVGIQGADITDGNRTLILALVWQIMRENIIQTLKKLGKHGRDIKDVDMISWANETVKRGGRHSRIQSFKDPSLRSSVFFLDLMNGINDSIVDYSLVNKGVTDDDAKLNAKYAISIARKLGATIFVLPEDIVEVKPKMMLTFVGSLMALDSTK